MRKRIQIFQSVVGVFDRMIDTDNTIDDIGVSWYVLLELLELLGQSRRKFTKIIAKGCL